MWSEDRKAISNNINNTTLKLQDNPDINNIQTRQKY